MQCFVAEILPNRLNFCLKRSITLKAETFMLASKWSTSVLLLFFISIHPYFILFYSLVLIWQLFLPLELLTSSCKWQFLSLSVRLWLPPSQNLKRRKESRVSNCWAGRASKKADFPTRVGKLGQPTCCPRQPPKTFHNVVKPDWKLSPSSKFVLQGSNDHHVNSILI